MQDWKKKKTDEVTVDVSRLMRTLWKRKWLLMIVVMIFGVISYCYSAFLITPTYQTSFTAYVNNRISNEGVGSTSTGDLNASIGLAHLYAQIIISRSVLTDAAEACGLDTSYEELAHKVSASITNNAALIYVSVVDTDPVLVTQFAEAITEIAPDHVARVVDGSSMRILDAPVQPTNKYAPSNGKNAVMGALLGLLIAAGILVIKEIVNDRVESAEELEARYEIPVIGSIPDMLHAEKNRDKYGYKKGGFSYR